MHVNTKEMVKSEILETRKKNMLERRFCSKIVETSPFAEPALTTMTINDFFHIERSLLVIFNFAPVGRHVSRSFKFCCDDMICKFKGQLEDLDESSKTNRNKPTDIITILVANRSKLLRMFADFKPDKGERDL
ncbi:hypothetical protein L6452_40529 [Arctium lappa]|uniref:Uncharacterized protein n=1 Tax=Arctium lappa TaxID=4217 RepID=A0ACB8XMJ6_ARCLA|nr:hypothetical protein L6452_40529 [Arctium lappa]